MKHWPQTRRLLGLDQTFVEQFGQVKGIRSLLVRNVIRWKQQRTTPDVSLRNRQLHHCFVVDYSELVMDILEMCVSALFLRDAHCSQATV